MKDAKSVFIAYTGGTIGMQQTADGYAPAPDYLREVLAGLPEFRSDQVPRYEIRSFEPLIDSANIAPEQWLSIARGIEEHYDDHDGFVVLHGTDTMAYTASALSFLLENLSKPVIVTGAQIPFAEVRNDARDNLLASLMIAGRHEIPEVGLYFGTRLFRGNRTRKVSAEGLDAFDSGNYPPLGKVGVEIEIDRSRLLPSPPPGEGLRIQPIGNPHIAAVRLFPGITGETVRNFLRDPLKGMVLEAYGVGNGPSKNRDFLAALEEAHERGVVIVDCTQCHRGAVHLETYATGRALARAGVISGYDLTAEAALTKLYYLFGKGLPPEEVRRQMQTPLRGEMTVRGET